MENQECQVQPQPQNWSWSLEESNILIENISYYQSMIETIERAKSLGPVKLPKAPKRKAKVNTTWDTWLSTQIDISIPHARKLRQLSNLLKGFKGFLNINVSINDILSKQELIKQMLEIDQFATFWRQVDIIPADDKLTPSQEV
ncbi:Hypothetical predicted protein [Mytilus galloprovincialis]|uniref:Uncharacterized protein n=1 Tax=Mytilus galloprovincialis TaxID=29158 RepID=A0A8B6DS50_MYTGA|nr:Hypothetical predicted protein [Mytilus galloprovincialis]